MLDSLQEFDLILDDLEVLDKERGTLWGIYLIFLMAKNSLVLTC